MTTGIHQRVDARHTTHGSRDVQIQTPTAPSDLAQSGQRDAAQILQRSVIAASLLAIAAMLLIPVLLACKIILQEWIVTTPNMTATELIMALSGRH